MLGFLKTNTHEKLRELLSSYSDGQVSADEATRVKTHLAECAACRAELEALRMTVSMVKGLPQLATLRVFKLETAPAAVKGFRAPMRLMGLATAGAAAVLIVLFVGDVTNSIGQRGEMDRPASTAELRSPKAVAANAPVTAALQPGQEVASVVTAGPEAAQLGAVARSAAAPAAPESQGTPEAPPAFAAAAQPAAAAMAPSFAGQAAGAAQTASSDASTISESPSIAAVAPHPSAPAAMATQGPTTTGQAQSKLLAPAGSADQPVDVAAGDTAFGAPEDSLLFPQDENERPAVQLPLRELEAGAALIVIALIAAMVWAANRGRRRVV